MSDLSEIKHLLQDRALSVAQMLLPNGVRDRHEWRVGSLGGEKGESLAVRLDGEKVGVWKDFNSGESGDIVDLWCAVRSRTLPEALDDLRDYLGLKKYEPDHPKKKPKYDRPAKPRCVEPKERVRDYLTQDRNLPLDVIARYKIGEAGTRIIFPFLLPDGTLALVKARDAEDGAKPVPTAANCEAVLFGWQAIPEDARSFVLTEGELDAVSMAAYGHPAMSVPFGGGGKGKQNWIENEFERLERFERIYLALDMDEPGEQGCIEIASRLGRHRCYRVTLPAKDANECLVGGIPKETIDRCIEEAKGYDPEGLRWAGEFSDQVEALFFPKQDRREGYTVPYRGLQGRLIFRPGDLTLWTGDTGDGKSMVISDCVPFWITEGSRFCLASYEMKCARTIHRVVKQAGGTSRPTADFLSKVMSFLDTGLCLYDKTGKELSLDELLEIFDFAHRKYGCDQFGIDSLMRLGIPTDDYAAQEKAVYTIVDWTVRKNVHTHLVAHSRKGERDRGAPTTRDIKGAMEIGANAANIVSVWRNRKVETVDDGSADMAAFTKQPGVVINVAKQRHGDFEGKVSFYWHRYVHQYFSSSDSRTLTRCYVSET